MTVVTYDGSYEGLLTAVFEIYEYKIAGPDIVRNDRSNGSLFSTIHHVETNEEKSNRVYKKLKDKLSANGLTQLFKTFLSEQKEIENLIYRYIVYVMSSKISVEYNFGHPDVLQVQQTWKKVHREKHRMEAFVRFQLSKDGLFYCLIQPDFNVLPLISGHFEKRYADQRWLIYDSRRKYGLYHNLEKVEEVSMHFTENVHDQKPMLSIADEREELYQRLWQQYFNSVNIAARKNMKLHIQHMPKRYWRWLTEKKG